MGTHAAEGKRLLGKVKRKRGGSFRPMADREGK